MKKSEEKWSNQTVEGLTHEELMRSDVNRIIANREKAKDPEWLRKSTEGVREAVKKPQWKKNLLRGIEENKENFIEAARLRAQDPLWIENQKRGREEAMNTEQYKESHRKGVERTKKSKTWQKNVKKANSSIEKRTKHSATVSGTGHSQFKGYIIGTNKETGEEIRLAGAKAVKDAGFCYSHVNNCINGKLKQHKGYTWRREEKGE